ncbi:hypothetical protein BH24ACT5_BH24ACT5_08220 [soil metagenome]
MNTTRTGLRITALVLAIAFAASCAGATDGPAGFCGWIGADVDDLGPITADDGTQTVGTWYHVFAEGITTADQPSRQAIATAAVADQTGYQRLRDEADPGVAEALDRLYTLIQDPDIVEVRHTDADVQNDIALIDAQGCDFLRQP